MDAEHLILPQNEHLILPQTKQLLSSLAQKYEVAAFTQEDPSQFLRWYSSPADIESACFIAAMLSFGSRKQFIPKIRSIFQLADNDGGMANWLKSGRFRKDFERSERKFYRFYSYADMVDLFAALGKVLSTHSTLGEAVHEFCDSRTSDDTFAIPVATRNSVAGTVQSSVLGSTLDFFRINFSQVSIVPKGKSSANKRLFMYLRWMVRQNSPVDLGLWTWFPQSELIIPLDIHVLQEAKRLGLIPAGAPASFKTAQMLTVSLKQIWSEDPCKGDFALFGVGVDEG